MIYVVKADDTPYQVARNGVKRLQAANANIIGVALNQLDFERADRYYGEYTGYYKYGYKRYYGARRQEAQSPKAALSPKEDRHDDGVVARIRSLKQGWREGRDTRHTMSPVSSP